MPYSNNSVDYIYSEDFLEHIPQQEVVFVMNEMWRVLKVGSKMEHLLPNAGSNNDFASPTHLSHWSPTTFEFFEDGNCRREAEEFSGIQAKFKIIKNEVINSGQGIHVIMEKVHV